MFGAAQSMERRDSGSHSIEIKKKFEAESDFDLNIVDDDKWDTDIEQEKGKFSVISLIQILFFKFYKID